MTYRYSWKEERHGFAKLPQWVPPKDGPYFVDLDTGYPPPSKWQSFRWEVEARLSRAWEALCGHYE